MGHAIVSVLTRVLYFKMQVTFEFEKIYVVQFFIYIYLPEKQNCPSPLKTGVRIKRFSAEQGSTVHQRYSDDWNGKEVLRRLSSRSVHCAPDENDRPSEQTKIFKLTSVFVPVYISELTRT